METTMEVWNSEEELSLSNSHVSTWFERDRANVTLYDDRNNRWKDDSSPILLDFWDRDVFELVEDGFLNPKDWHSSLVEYYNHLY